MGYLSMPSSLLAELHHHLVGGGFSVLTLLITAHMAVMWHILCGLIAGPSTPFLGPFSYVKIDSVTASLAGTA